MPEIDHRHDRNDSLWLEIVSAIEPPDFVKEASIADMEDVLERTCFADRLNARYPVHTQADAWVSCAYFNKQASGNAAVEESLRAFADLWQFDFDSTRIPLDKEASEVAPLAEIVYERDGEVLEKVAAYTAEHLVSLVDDCVSATGLQEMPWEMRQKTAAQLIDAFDAGLFECSFDKLERLEKCAGQGVGSLDKVASELRLRKNTEACRKSTYGEFFDKLAADAAEACDERTGLVPAEDLQKIAQAIDAFDRSAGLVGRSGFCPASELFEHVPAQHAMIEQGMVKVAGCLDLAVSKEALATPEAAAYFTETLGLDISPGIEKVASTLNPRLGAAVQKFLQSPENTSMQKAASAGKKPKHAAKK